MTLQPCRVCHQHIQMGTHCPHCSEKPLTSSISVALLLGIGLMGCGDKDEDTATESEPAEEPASEPVEETMYGVPSE